MHGFDEMGDDPHTSRCTNFFKAVPGFKRGVLEWPAHLVIPCRELQP